MAFNEILMSLLSIKTLINDKRCDEILNVAVFNGLPESTKLFIKEFETALKENGPLKEFFNPSSSSITCMNGLYNGAFCNGITDVIQDCNRTLLGMEESFLRESTLQVFEKLDQYIYTLTCLNSALIKAKEEKFKGCKVLDLCEILVASNSHVPENVFRKLQKHCLNQFYKQTKLWISQGLLFDPYLEYFIVPTDESFVLDSSACSMTNAGGVTLAQIEDISEASAFKVNPDNLPSLIPLSIAMKILFIGEALSVCRHKESKSQRNETILSACGINEKNLAIKFSKIEKETFCLNNFGNLIDELWTGVNSYILQISNEIGNVKDQLVLMREMYLLGRGELFQEFLLKGSSLLDADFTVIDSTILNTTFKDAIYYVYLSEYSDLADQFFFKLPKVKALRQGFTAWSVMELKCKVKWPLHYLFTKDVLLSFNQLFIFLLKLKKAQIDITSTRKSINSIVNHRLRIELLEIRMHLLAVVGNFQNYCLSNVIVSEMTALLESAQNARMFSDLQKALNLFLININNYMFLPNPYFVSSTFSSNVESFQTVNKSFETIFDLCKLFSELDVKHDENILLKLKSIKMRLHDILKSLFSVLNKIDQTCYYNVSNFTSHLHSLMMCLDYNSFFHNKYKLSSFTL